MGSPLNTERLIMRQWKEEDLLPFYKMNSDPDVMKFLPRILSKRESDELAFEIQCRIEENGWGLWAIEDKATNEFIGFVGLNKPKVELPFNPCIEVGWRIARKYWGNGFATEAGRKALEYAFITLLTKEVMSFTAAINKRSEAVMRRLGMTNTHSNFNHPGVPPNNPLHEHVLYSVTSENWQFTAL